MAGVMIAKADDTTASRNMTSQTTVREQDISDWTRGIYWRIGGGNLAPICASVLPEYSNLGQLRKYSDEPERHVSVPEELRRIVYQISPWKLCTDEGQQAIN